MVKGKKAPRQDEPDDSHIVLMMDRRTVAELEPEDRATWLSKACRLANEGVMRTSQLFDVMMAEKVVDGVPEKLGRRMMNTLKKHMGVFSDKQQKSLKNAPLMLAFEIRREPNEDGSTGGKRFNPAAHDPDAAAKMEEMMARCRDFVREKASTYDERLAEVQAKEEIERIEKERLQRKHEWEQIAVWHQQLEGWEISQMAAEDLRVQQRVRETEAARRQMEIRKEAERKDEEREAAANAEARREVDAERRRERDERPSRGERRSDRSRGDERQSDEDKWAESRRRAEEEYQRHEHERLATQEQQEAERAAWNVAEDRRNREREDRRRHEDDSRSSEVDRATARAVASAQEIMNRKRTRGDDDQVSEPHRRRQASKWDSETPPVAGGNFSGGLGGGTLSSLLSGSGYGNQL